MVHPLWETWGDLVSNAETQLANLEDNREYYQKMYQESLEKKDDPETLTPSLPEPNTEKTAIASQKQSLHS